MNWIKRILQLLRTNSSLTIIITAAILIELISVGQYLHTRGLLFEELEKRAESELTNKAIVTKNSLAMVEKSLQGHVWDMKRNMAEPDSLYAVTEGLLRSHRNVIGCAIAVVPGFYPEKGRLFEPYSYWKDGDVVNEQAAGPQHDYTQSQFYQMAEQEGRSGWTEPYVGDKTQKKIVTFSKAVHDENGKFVAAFGIDVALDWMGDTLNYRHIYPSSYDLLLTEKGAVIAKPRDTIAKAQDIERVIAMINDSTVAKKPSGSGKSKVFEFTSHDGDKAYAFVTSFAGTPRWQIAVVCYDSEVYDKLNRSGVFFTLLNLVAMAVLALIVLGFARNRQRLQRIRMEQERINGELQIARDIQMQMLPEKFPPFPERDDLDIYASLVPAKEVGGDIFDFFLRDGKLFFCIGDVSGKGVPEAMVMAVTHAYFRSASTHEDNPARIMQSINTTSCQGNDSNMFVTFFIGVLDLATGRLCYCNAGHDHPLLVSKGVEELQAKPNMPIGVFDTLKFDVQEMQIPPMTTLFLYTDGLTEAKDKQHRQFTFERVKAVMKQHTQDSPQRMLETMSQEVANFVEDAEQSDDLTMLAIRYQPKQAPKDDIKS